MKRLSHWALAPPMERTTFLPYCCQVDTSLQGKFALSTRTEPLLAMLANARTIRDDLAFVSSDDDCPQ